MRDQFYNPQETRVARAIREEIERTGPITVARFMELALYLPEHGYYRSTRSPFGKHGDFFTAEQIQPVFGRLVARAISRYCEELGNPSDFQVVEVGAGTAAMTDALSRFRYVAIEVDDHLPENISGVFLANEFFDALPVHLIRGTGEVLVSWSGDRLHYTDPVPLSAELRAYLDRFGTDQSTQEVNLNALDWLSRMARALRKGYILTIDYGFTRSEALRFQEGSLMSYRCHTASPDILQTPGARDITAHVNFDMLQRHGEQCGLETIWFGTLGSFLLQLGERDRFASILEGDEPKHRLQLKTLLFGMGETFRVLVQRKRQ